jgi:hypothetical protein
VKPRPVFFLGALTASAAVLLALAGATLFLVGRSERSRARSVDGSFEVIVTSSGRVADSTRAGLWQ